MRETRLGSADLLGRSERLGRVFLILVAFLAMCGTIAVGQIAVTVTIKDVGSQTACTGGTGICPEPSLVGEQYAVEFEVLVTGSNPSSLTPYGTVTVDDGAGGTNGVIVSTGSYPTGWSSYCNLTSTSAGVKTITATFVPSNGFTGGSDTEFHTVNKASTVLTLATVPDPSVLGETVTLTADATASAPGGGSPTGTVLFKIGTSVLGSGSLASTGTNTSRAVITTSTIPSGTHTITAQYTGSSDYNGSNATEAHTVSERNTTTTVFGSSTPLVVGDTVTCTVTVTGTSPGEAPMPTGPVTVSVSPTGQGSPVSWSRTLIAANAGQFTFTYTPSSAADTSHTFTATYDGASDSTYSGSNGSFVQAIIKRATDVQLTCNPSTAYIFQDVACQVHVEDDTTVGTPATPTGTVTFSDGSGKNGVFTVGGTPSFGDIWSLDGMGNLTVTYTPGIGDAGTTTITATYSGSFVHSGKSTTELLTVDLRPTQTRVVGSMTTLLVNQQLVYSAGSDQATVTVSDVAGVGASPSPSGTLSYSASVPGVYATLVGAGSPPSATYSYLCSGLDAAAGFDTIQANYTATDGIHANSAGAFGQGIQRRPTATTLSGCASTATGCTCTATVTEKTGNLGSPVGIAGNLAAQSPATTSSGSAPNWAVTTTTDALIAIVSVSFEPTNKVHLASTALANVNRSDQFTPVSNDGSTGADCDDGCGSGGLNVDEIIKGINIAEVTLTAVQMGLEVFATVLDVIPDVVTGGGVFVIVGVTIPISDIIAAVTAGAGIAIDIAVTAMTTDIDGDGLPDVVEATIGTDPYKVDTDGDGMGDADEISEAGGWCGGSRRPNPLVKDSDGDGLEDGEEGSYGTSVCVADTDCDGVIDGGQNLAALGETETWAYTDIRNHADPLMQDTDGDGLRDDLEIDAGCPYVSDDDSDDDGLQDGYEDSNRDGTITNTIGTSLTQGSGETDFCRADTDGDGLLDGQEEGMFGTSVTPKRVSALVGDQGENLGVTVPALDPDMDNDGLSDEEETNTYQTDPKDADTDDDMVSDGAEVDTWASGDSRNHSNPREDDTDGDGLTDNLEIAAGCNCGAGTDGYVNDDDSDDDGLQDGEEFDLFTDGADVAAANSNDGELEPDGVDTVCCLCDPDSDGDGLSDGEEVHTGTLPLDWDSDNDGLSDREELQVYFTNPLDPDTDGDGAEGILTERPAEGESLLSGYAGPTHTASITKHDCISGTSVTQSVTFYTGMELKSDGVEALSRTGQFPFDALGDQLDPLQGDTDGDGIGDATEFAPGCGGCSGGTGGLYDGFANNDDSDGDGLGDYLDAKKDVPTAVNVDQKPSDRAWIGWPEPQDADGFLGTTDAGLNDGELDADEITGICDPDSDGDGILDGLEHQIGTDPYDWDTDDDGRGDGEELTGGGPIPSDPADFDTDDDGLGDGVEVYGANPTNPVNADTDSDGLSDGGVFTPSAVAGIDGSGTSPLCTTGVSDHPNPYGYGEDENGDGAITATAGETNPNDPDSDDDALGDGVEKLAYSTSRQGSIPATDLFGRAITVNYPPTGSTITYPDCSCLNPLDADTDDDGLDDGVEDLNHDGNFDFASSDFDFDVMPLLGPPHPDPEETNPCDPDTDHDGLTDYEERNPSSAYPFNPTNPLDHDTDNDWLTDGYEVHFTCTVTEFSTLDNDLDGRLDEDPVDGIDNDGDGLIDEDPVDFAIRSVPVLNPTDRDSDSDGFIDGLDEDPCNSDLIPVLVPALGEPTDSDGDGFADIDELLAGTSEFDPEDHPVAFGQVDLDFDECIDDRIWLEPFLVCCQPVDLASAVTIDLDSNALIDLRLAVLARNVTRGDFDGDGSQDDVRYVIEYLLSNYRAVQAKIVATITDFDGDLVIDRVVVERK